MNEQQKQEEVLKGTLEKKDSQKGSEDTKKARYISNVSIVVEDDEYVIKP